MAPLRQIWQRFAMFAAVASSLAGCATSTAATAGVDSAQHTAVAVSDEQLACTLLSDGVVSSTLGAPVTGRPFATDPGASGCTWQNAWTFESVTLMLGPVGSSGTPPDSAYLEQRGAQFDISGRAGTIEVAKVGMSAAAERDAGQQLADSAVAATYR